MNKVLGMVLLAVVVGACSKSDKEGEKTEEKVTETVPQHKEEPASGDPVAEGKKLISNSDCFACHKEEGKLIGPAYVEVAKKYEATDANIEYLSGKIINGGSGVWGQVAMAPHPGISKEDSKKMVRYILSLRK